ncbi:MAG: methyl-accepting chemotaxis protein [Syntrophales bacterium]|jgi:methyl-accepting chemotaxis protein
MKKRTLGFKLVAGGIIAVMIPLLVIGIFAAVKASGALETAAKERAMTGAHNIAGIVQEVLAVEIKVASELAMGSDAVNAAANADVDVMNKQLADAMAKIGKDYEAMMVTDANGVVIADGNKGEYKGLSLAERDYFQQAKGGKANVGSVVKSKKTGDPIAAVCAPIMKDGRFAGTVVLALKIAYLSEKVTEKVGQTGYGFMIDRTGLAIAHPDKDKILSLNITTVNGMEEISKKMVAKERGVHDYVYQGTKKIAGFAPVELTGWSVCLTQNADEFLSAAHSIRNFIAITGIIFLIVTIVAVTFFARSISSPIKSSVAEMGEASNQVAAASSQVAASSQSLAEGASEQASAIEETSSSLEEMSAMTKQNAGNASQADILMKQANQVVQKANVSMESLTKSMKEITAASEETSKIIKTIDEIAFQTNLLALNAAVEAARAGEAGAGFAVVAEEVRNLAMRAADAAKNTSGLIEGTVKKIKDGSNLVIKTNEAFAEVAVSASKVGELVGEIAAASQEQAQGIDQINKAVAEMDKVTQQTAANAEESASASEEMNAQAEQMKHISSTLANIIGGSANGAGNGDRANIQVKKGIRGALAAAITRKGIGKNVVPYKKGKEVRPDRVIPLEEGDFKDF